MKKENLKKEIKIKEKVTVILKNEKQEKQRDVN